MQPLDLLTPDPLVKVDGVSARAPRLLSKAGSVSNRIDRPRSPFGPHRHSLALPEEEAAWSAAVFLCREGVKKTSRDVSYAKRELTPRTGPLTSRIAHKIDDKMRN